MPKHKINRKISLPPPMEGFRPFGVPMRDIEPVILLLEEYEAIRLADYKNLSQEEAASEMKISRPTFTRLYDKARKNIAKAFIEGKAIFIQGGNFITDDYWYRCHNCHETMITLKPLKHCRKCESRNIILLNCQTDDSE